MVKKLRMAGHAAEHGAVAQGDQDLAAFAHADGHFFVGRIVDAAFQDADVHAAFIRVVSSP